MKRKAVRLMVNLRSVYQGPLLAPSGSFATTAITAQGGKRKCHARPPQGESFLLCWAPGLPSDEPSSLEGRFLEECPTPFPSTPGPPRIEGERQGSCFRENLTLVLLVPDDDEEGDAGAEGVDGDGHLAQHAGQLAAHGPHHLLVGPLIAGLGAVGQDDEATDDENQHTLRAGAEQDGVGKAWQPRAS